METSEQELITLGGKGPMKDVPDDQVVIESIRVIGEDKAKPEAEEAGAELPAPAPAPAAIPSPKE